MKSTNFKRRETTLRSLEVSNNRKVDRKVNWDRRVYFLILSIFLFFLIRYLINHFLYIEGDGQVLFDSVDIRNTEDCRIIDFYREEGDQVRIGDSLFSYIQADENGNFSSPSTTDFSVNNRQITAGDISWAEREMYSVREEMGMTRIKLKADKEQIRYLKSDLDRIKNGVALDALPRFRLEEQIAKINALESSIISNNARLIELQRSLGQLSAMKRDLGSSSQTIKNKKTTYGGANGGNGTNRGDNIFYSPLAGTVTNLMKKEFEVALKSENILSIHKPENVYIKAFFNQEDLKSLKEGQTVTLTFPDGSESEGVIRRFYFATYRLPEEFQKKYEPTTRSLSADIYPIDPSDLYKWKTYWKMAVKITKFKY